MTPASVQAHALSRPASLSPHPKGCTDVDPDLVDRLRAMVTHRTDAALTERFGISYNTWRKLIAGMPVRASVLSRLEARVAMLEAQGDMRRG
ncbi:hypothetical protein LWE61_17910 [Sphingobium sufflavum]|uniref:hypothetical protein n=1 Tax=Sphingobium sufflavum TaxID=1129547 RepID=UPI001F3889BD|nr:hypothetical protein [Sphingobium sufflavum]MCE7798417.1 hypothetical protein [Sphingobium sufflavum]